MEEQTIGLSFKYKSYKNPCMNLACSGGAGFELGVCLYHFGLRFFHSALRSLLKMECGLCLF